MTTKQKSLLAKSQGSTTGKLKKKHLFRAKVLLRGLEGSKSKLTNDELTTLLG